MIASREFRDIILGELAPSPTNPRKHFDQDAIDELAATIRDHGVIEPIIVRPWPAGYDTPEGRSSPPAYEIVAGERRYRASHQAGLQTIPAIVRGLNTRQVLEIQVIENLQRRGVSELEEADGYDMMMRECNYTADELAAKVGKSRAYIYGRLKLTALCEPARVCFREGKLSASIALLIARIPAQALQVKALAEVVNGVNGWGGPMSYREAARHVQNRYMLHIKDAPWPLDATLLVEAPRGAIGGTGTYAAITCNDCPNRTANNRELFGDVDADACTDPDCWQQKRTAWSAKLKEEARNAGHAVMAGDTLKKLAAYGVTSEHSTVKGHTAVQGHNRKAIEKAGLQIVMVENSRDGTLIPFVSNKELAKIPAPKKRETDHEHQVREREEEAKREQAYRERLVDQILERVAEEALDASDKARLDLHGMRLVARQLYARSWDESRKDIVRMFTSADDGTLAQRSTLLAERIEAMPAPDLLRLLYALALRPMTHCSAWNLDDTPGPLIHTAREWAVDPAALRAEMAPTPTEAARAGELDALIAKGVRYAHPDDYTLTWTGRGKKPAWVTAWIDQGNALEELEVAQQAARASSKTDQEEEENSGRDAAGGMEHGASTAEDMEQAA